MNNPFHRFSGKEQTLFAKRLSFLVRSGAPLLSGLRILKEQMPSKGKIKILESVISDVESGKNLSSSLRKFQHMFGGFTVNIIRAGEIGGILQQNLDYLAEELEKKHELKKKVLGALLYPLFVFLATCVTAGFLVFFIFPKITPIFKSLHIELPIATAVLIAITDFLLAYGMYLLMGISVLCVAFVVVQKTLTAFRRAVHAILLRLPIFGKLIQLYCLTSCLRTLGLLLQSNVRIVESCAIVADTTENLIYREAFLDIAEKLREGRKTSEEFKQYSRIFTKLVGDMIAIGETSGNLSETLIYLSKFYERELEAHTKNLANTIEPALMIFMGLIVGYIVISVITPIYGITQHLAR